MMRMERIHEQLQLLPRQLHLLGVAPRRVFRGAAQKM